MSGASNPPPAVTSEQIIEALRGVLDPELGMSVVDLGLIYDVHIEHGTVSITMTLTAPGCPIHDAMTMWVQRALMRLPGVSEVDVKITFDPPWTPERIRLEPGSSRPRWARRYGSSSATVAPI